MFVRTQKPWTFLFFCAFSQAICCSKLWKILSVLMVGGLKFQQKKSENRIDFNSFSSMANTFSFILFAPDKRNKSHSTRTGTKNKSLEQQFNVSIFFFFSSMFLVGVVFFFAAHVFSFVFGRCAFCCRHCLDEYCDRLLVSVPSYREYWFCCNGFRRFFSLHSNDVLHERRMDDRATWIRQIVKHLSSISLTQLFSCTALD